MRPNTEIANLCCQSRSRRKTHTRGAWAMRSTALHCLLLLLLPLLANSYLALPRLSTTTAAPLLRAASILFDDVSLLRLAIKTLPTSSSSSSSSSTTDTSTIQLGLDEVSDGLKQWSHALENGYVPEHMVWPRNAVIFNAMVQTLTELQLPRLTQRHPQLINAVLKSLLEIAAEFRERVDDLASSSNNGDKKEENREKTIEEYENEGKEEEWGGRPGSKSEMSIETFEAELALSLMRKFASAWAPPLGGLSSLDELFGASHGLLSPGGQDEVGGGGGGAGGGFGLFDAVWHHTGFTEMKTLQKRLREMRELKDLIKALGRRPSVNGDEFRPTLPQIAALNAPPGVARSSLVRTEVTGIKRGDALEGLLPSETVLLSRRRGGRLKLLFLAKLAEKSLASYDVTGWQDERSTSKRKPWRHFSRLPTSTGGPIIVALDTSFSMTGPRESLAKAVVLESASLAAKDNRPFYLLAFAGSGNVASLELKLGSDKLGLVKLLDFLSYSFHGGTDVAAPLNAALDLLQNTVEWASSDVLLVTDGELESPPISKQLMEKKLGLENERGLEVHGLIVGRERSLPLETVCTSWDGKNRVHNFLNKYDPLLALLLEQKKSSLTPVPVPFDSSSSSSAGLGRVKKDKRWKREMSLRMSSDVTSEESSVVSLSPLLLKEKLFDVIAQLGQGLIERDSEMRLLLLAALSREHILLFGPPGTGKSECSTRLSSVLGQGKYFERLLTKYTNPEELFGPLSLSALEQDEYVRQIDGYLPTAEVAFLDEVFKSSSSILNALLGVLNERKFDNGNKRVSCLLICCVGASNELPDSEELDALYDRFLIRKIVTQVSDSNIELLLNANLPSFGSTPSSVSLIAHQDALDLLARAKHVTLPADVVSLLRSVRTYLRDQATPSIYISDRRLRQAANMLRVSAAANGRNYVSLVDVLLLKHVFWYSLDDIPVVEDCLWANLLPENNKKESDVFSIRFLTLKAYNRLVDCLSSSLSVRREDIQSEMTELDALLIAVTSKHDTFVRLLADLGESHLFLSESELANARYRLSDFAKGKAQEFAYLKDTIVSLQVALQKAPPSSSFSSDEQTQLLDDLKLSWTSFAVPSIDDLYAQHSASSNSEDEHEEDDDSDNDGYTNNNSKKKNKKNKNKRGG